MAPPKIRFCHEELEIDPKLSRLSAKQVYEMQVVDFEYETQRMEALVRQGRLPAFDAKARRLALLSLAGFQVMQAKGGFSRPDAPVARYVVADGLFRAMLETEPPREAFTPNELRMPQDSVIVRWPTGEETYVMTAARYEYLAPRILGFPILTGSDAPHRLLWIQRSHSNIYGGELWFGEISEQPVPQVGITPPPDTATPSQKLVPPPGYDEVSWRQALLRSLLVYLTTGVADAIPVTPAKARYPGDGLESTPQKMKERHFGYIHLGSRTRLLTTREVEDECRKQGKPLENIQRVCGHWKQQAHGPKFALRKWLWIKPYMRGPEGTEPIDRVRVVTL